MVDIDKHVIQTGATVILALDKLNNLGSDLTLTLFIIDNEQVILGTITDGDIRRGLINGLQTTDVVDKFMNKHFHFLQQNNYDIDKLDELRRLNIQIVPIVDENNRIIRIINLSKKKSILPIDVVIMAGGRGERLRPLTDSIPKPLLHIGEKPIIEYNIDRLYDYGAWNMFITVNYLADQIIDWINSKDKYNGIVNYVKEKKPLGTIGSVSLIRDKFKHNTVLITNSDLLTNINYEEFYRSFIESNADMILATIPYLVNIPYAVIETQDNKVISFKEKPIYNYQSNAGIYLIKKELLDLIPDQNHINATDFMQLLISKGYNVTTFPVFNYWLDIGRYEDYIKAQNDLKNIKF
ncbi:MAG: hypothetical protein A2X02_06665 [Bacteroidetes bacterium GWF2_29_10]|nr:MAG: hypothetical protein A2X02_06665 [Bacteroidetes bacterium GWF2_29_10]